MTALLGNVQCRAVLLLVEMYVEGENFRRAVVRKFAGTHERKQMDSTLLLLKPAHPDIS